MFSFFRKVKETPKHEVLHALKMLDVYQNHDYEGKTAEEITEFQEKLHQTINRLIEEDHLLTEKAEEVKKEAEVLQERLNNAHQQWENHKKSMKESVEKGLVFVQSTNFYPPEYVFHLNKIEGFITDMTELQQKDPLADANEFYAFRDQVEQDIAAFSALHQETIQLVQKIQQKVEQKQKQESQTILEIKESLFRALQMGNLVQARSDLKKLKKEIKRF